MHDAWGSVAHRPLVQKWALAGPMQRTGPELLGDEAEAAVLGPP